MKSILSLILLLFYFPAGTLLAQSSAENARSGAIRQMIAAGHQALGENSILFSGKEYTGYDHQFKGDPYFLSDSMKAGSVWYNGLYFQDIPMLYDMLNDDLIILNFSNDIRIRLVKERTDSFRLYGHFFIRISANNSESHALPTGFYDEMYAGKTSVVCKRWKSGIMPIDPGQPARYVQNTAYFVKKGDSYRSIHSKREFLSLLTDKRKQVLKFLRSHNLNYREDPGLAMSRGAEYYDQLN